MLQIRCKDHPNYEGKWTPTLCNGCWYVFGVRMFIHGSENEKLQFKTSGTWPQWTSEEARTVEGDGPPTAP
jgi:hypothetical protein